MKQSELKRALLGLSLFCIFLFIYLYWQQSSTIITNINNSDNNNNINNYVKYNSINKIELRTFYRSSHITRKKEPPQWTWQCINQHCERHHSKRMTPVMSLSTCSMLCGSTQLWPQPTGPVTLGSRASTFHYENIHLKTNAKGITLSLIENTFINFNRTIMNLVSNYNDIEKQTKKEIQRILVKISIYDNNIVKLKLDTNESYNLTIRSHNRFNNNTKNNKYTNDNEVLVNIYASNFFGARHGIETLSQLIWWDDYEESLKILKSVSIQDAPIFKYRGIMIDTARNFMSIDSLKRVLIGMAANKLNVLHWHITDSQSFPLVSPRVPQLAKYGAYGDDQTYKSDDIKALVEFARVHGIRIVLEVDTPAHAGSGWNFGPYEGLGELAVCINARPWSLYCGEPPCGQLNPKNPNVYDILEKLYRDLLEISDENELFHLGGDEVNLECWAQHLQTNTPLNYTDLHDLWGEFTLKALERLQKANNGKTIPSVIVWSSNLSKRPYIKRYLNKTNIVVQSWGSSQWPDTSDLLSDGYRVLISHVDAWYLDCGFGKWRETGEAACDPYRSWQTIYSHQPWQQFHWKKKQIIGGEVCLWSEQLDEVSLDTRLWPRAAAFAERMWSDPQQSSSATSTYIIQEDVYTRLNTQRKRLISKGLEVEALWPKWCVQNPGMCL